MQIGSWVSIGDGARLEVVSVSGSLVIEHHVRMEDFVHVGAAERVQIGEHTVIASMVTILDHDHGLPDDLTSVLNAPLVVAPVTIGRGVWIGEKATILKGVTIGDGAVIGANAVVVRDVPAGAIAVGVPARVVKQRA